MSILGAILLMAAIGVVTWLITSFLPMAEKIKSLIVTLAIIFVVIIAIVVVAQLFGVDIGLHIH